MAVPRRLAWTALFGVAFGWVEAAVVVYLRRIFYPDGFGFPLVPIDPELLAVELAREAATLLMLLAVAMLAGRRSWERFGHFLVAFGLWDLAYYAGLKAALGWPPGPGTFDILFLLPAPWTAPVYAPALAAALMVVGGTVAVSLEAAGHPGRADRRTWALGAAGAGLLLWTFLRDTAAGTGQAPPEPYPWPAMLLGDALLAACLLRFVRLTRAAPRPAGRSGR